MRFDSYRRLIIMQAMLLPSSICWAHDRQDVNQNDGVDQPDKNDLSVERILQAIGRLSVEELAEAYSSEVEPLKRGRIGSLLATVSTSTELLMLRDSKDASLAVFAEWQLTLRELETMLLHHLNRSERNLAALGYSLRSAAPMLVNGVNVESDYFKKFMTFLEERVDVLIPKEWREGINGSDYFGEGVLNTVVSSTSARAYLLSRETEVRISGLGSKCELSIQGVTLPWNVPFLNRVAIEVIEYVTRDDWCFLVVSDNPDDIMNMEVIAVKRGQKEPVWRTRSRNVFDRRAKSGTQSSIAFAVVSLKAATLTVFYLHPTFFAIDVLALKTGERKWCFSSRLPQLLDF